VASVYGKEDWGADTAVWLDVFLWWYVASIFTAEMDKQNIMQSIAIKNLRSMTMPFRSTE
jgi:hypothetical protein